MPQVCQTSDLKHRLIELLRRKSLRIGRFKLTSGKTSDYYFDAKLTTLDPEGAYLSAKLVLDEIVRRGIRAKAIGGLTLGADPIVAAVAAISFAERKRYQPIQGFIARQEAKGHGTRQFIEGFRGEPGTPVIVIDDVCTTGASTLQAIRRAEEAGYTVAAVLCLVDREEGGADLLRDYSFFALLKASQLLDDPAIQKELSKVKQ